MKRHLLYLILISLSFSCFSQSFKREILGSDTIFTLNLPKDCWCEFNDSIKNGKIRAINPANGVVVYTGFFKNYKRDGIWKTYSLSGDTSITELRIYNNGLLDGYSFYNSGESYRSGNYKNGLREGMWEEKSFNHIYSYAKGNYKNNKRVGIWLFYDTLGKIKQQNNYGEGLELFEKTLWHNYEKNIIKEKGLCFYGEVGGCLTTYMELWHGETEIYNLSGFKTGKRTYEKGVLLSAEEYYDNGFLKVEISDLGRTEKEWFENGQLKKLKIIDSLYIKEWFPNGQLKSYYKINPNSTFTFRTLINLWDSTGIQLVANGLGEYSDLNSKGEKVNIILTNKFKKYETYNENGQLIKVELIEYRKKRKTWEYEYLDGKLNEERFYILDKLKKTIKY